MSHSYSTIWIHAVWATKERQPLIKSSWENDLYSFLKNQLFELSCPVQIINGMPDHIHCLFQLNPQKSISEVIKQLKGSSSHWINLSDLINEKFAWQTGFAAYSVSDSIRGKVFDYIQNQKAHHRKVTFQEEYEALIRKIQTQEIKNG
ncbi:IS200/IS605 family transposase [Algoriphagus kandeliae]|uniref:IS200/IS605 family transposase n=1 Tax=Algoriphagus kandeliae TaxID=2562278 RepID=A0A4Y9QX22_9BACT|nr:IS200/IS605 family transposase [Algoriphagus kandeliae]TFV95783.1 IS200/IS605 family transposase [Algoriphagus kandeliae]